MKKFVLILLGLMLVFLPLYAIDPVIASGPGAFHTVILNSDGKVYAWGYNVVGQLGDSSWTDSHVPVKVDASGVLSGKTITAIAVGCEHTAAVDSEGKVYAWGENSQGQLGNNSTTDSHVPIAIGISGVLSGKIITAIAAGYEYTIALDSDGKVYAWGDNNSGQLGNNSTTDSHIPVAVDISGVLLDKTITAIAAGDRHTVALDSDGEIYTWGNNFQGQLGDNSTTYSHVPVAVDTSGVLSGKTITAIAAGDYHTVALDSDGKVNAWGDNYYGTLGNNSTTDSHVPIAVDTNGVLSSKTITAIAVGYYHTVALDSYGKIYAWGENSQGQLGNNSTTKSLVPVAIGISGVLSGKIITAIAGGRYHTIALDSDSKVYAWGSNHDGQLGNNSTTQSNVPIQVLGLGGTGELALPITLHSFAAQEQHGNIVLTWQTASETNNARFVIYRNNIAITSIDGAGTCNEPHTYSYTDNSVVPGASYTYVLADIDYANEETKYIDNALTVTIPENDIPTEFALEANYPNPFNPTTAISYSIFAEATMDRQLSVVNLSIFDMNGKKVATLVKGSKPAGYHSVNWDASKFSSGIYFYRLQAEGFVDTKKMVFMK
jgi:alpha-tubulin suppressor-like RCC1 family protein